MFNHDKILIKACCTEFLKVLLPCLPVQQLLVRSQEAMQGDAEEQAGCPGTGNSGLAHLLLDSYQERLIQNQLEDEQDREDAAQEEEEEEEDDDEGEGILWSERSTFSYLNPNAVEWKTLSSLFHFFPSHFIPLSCLYHSSLFPSVNSMDHPL